MMADGRDLPQERLSRGGVELCSVALEWEFMCESVLVRLHCVPSLCHPTFAMFV